MAVFDYMNAATVKANLKDSLENVKMELQNVRALTGETANLANMWEAFIRQQISRMKVHGKKWLNARIKHTNTELVKATKKYQMTNAELKGRENAADWNKTKNRERNAFDQLLKKEKAHMMTVGHKITALEKERDELVRQIQKAKGPAKKPLQDKKNDVKKHLTAAKADLEAKKRIVGKTQRKILELTAAGVQQILHTLQKDKQTLAQYRNSVSALQMPTI
jgi:chromosome segregation ATPase